MSEKGKLYICGTPIGNLDDTTFRAVKTLEKVDLIAAEDTRRTEKLLNHFKIDNNLTSYHEHNEREKAEKLITELKDGYDIALVSDAGMPGISDPGLILIKEAIQAKIEIIPVPGPTALIPALVVSGIQTDKFSFFGFVPRKGKEREQFIEEIINEEKTTIFYESPYRIKKIFEDLSEKIPERKAALIREITKIHEEKIYGTVSEIQDKIASSEIKGEIVVVIEGRTKEEVDTESWTDISILEHVQLFMDNGYTKKEAIKKVAEVRGIQKKKVYKEAIQINVNR
ncbi:MAG TPA: 16S rRNA (cytidine(1402)-2'-O)-methyltransferase [Halanaerobiales bacterium]|nr:16S rRNA (cytidine(1402)-2'-O)-methyltransferase [Halanaerobiales bacterium]